MCVYYIYNSHLIVILNVEWSLLSGKWYCCYGMSSFAKVLAIQVVTKRD